MTIEQELRHLVELATHSKFGKLTKIPGNPNITSNSFTIKAMDEAKAFIKKYSIPNKKVGTPTYFLVKYGKTQVLLEVGDYTWPLRVVPYYTINSFNNKIQSLILDGKIIV